MTLAEIMASLQAGQSAGFGRAGSELSMTAERERRAIERAQRELVEQEKRAGREAERREKRRGVGRAVGTVIGGLLALPTGGVSLAAGMGLGSLGGQAVATSGQRVRGVESGLGRGMFYSGQREKLSSAEMDVNRFISDANKGFTNQILASAAQDYFLGRGLGQLESVGKYATLASGSGRQAAAKQMLLDFRDLFYRPKTLPGATISSPSLMDVT